MKMRILSIFAVCLLSGLGTQANASLQLDPTLSIGDSFYLGRIVNGAPSSPTAEASYVNFLNDLAPGAGPVLGPPAGPNANNFDRIGSTLAGPFPDVTDTGSVTDNNAVNTINTLTIFSYVYAKYGGDAHVWFNTNGFAGEITVPANNTPGQGISHLALFDPTGKIPEPGSLLVWASLGMVGLVTSRRRRF